MMNNLFLARTVAALALTAAFSFTSPVRAHSDEYFDANPSPHGGQVRMSGPFHFELVLSEERMVVYVTDHANQPIKSAGAVAKIEITADGKTSKFDLLPEGENLLVSGWSGAPPRDLIARLSVKFPGQKAYSAKFVPPARKRK